MTLLSVCQDVATECGIVQPTSIIGSTDPNALKLLRIANKTATEMYIRHDWQKLLIMHTWTATATQTQADGPPSATGYSRLEYNAELWNTTTSTRYVGPYSGNSWHNLVASTTSGMGATPAWRIIGGVLNIYPVPTAGDTLSMPYISGLIFQSSSLTLKGAYTADDDQFRLSESVQKLGAVWRWKQSNGLDYAEDMSDFERRLDMESARDAGTRVMVPRRSALVMPAWSGVVDA